MNELYTDEKWLREQYEVSLRSWNSIAEECGVGGATIRRWAKKFGIESRTSGDGCKLKWQDQAYREKATAGIRKGLSSNKELRAKNSRTMWDRDRDRLLSIMRSAEYRDKQRNAQRLRMMRPIDYDKAVKTLRANLADRGINEKRLAKMRMTCAGADYRAAISARSRRLWLDDDYRIRTVDGMRKAITSATRLRISTTSTLVWQRPGHRQKMSVISRSLWDKAVYRSKQAAALSSRPATSILERLVVELLAQRGIAAQPEAHGPWTFDVGFENDGKRFLIECQGTYWHRKPAAVVRDRQKKTYYDRYLSGTHELHYIHEHEFYGINKLSHILDHILSTAVERQEYRLADVRVELVDNAVANNFFWKHHYLGRNRCGMNVGAYMGDVLIACCQYGSITRTQSAARFGLKPAEVLELTRFCIRPDYRKKNLASWLLSRTAQFLPSTVKCLLSFADEGAGHSGTIYRAAGWSFDGRTKPNYWYVDSNGHRYHKKSVWDQAKRLHMNEFEYADSVGLSLVRGLPVLRFVKWI